MSVEAFGYIRPAALPSAVVRRLTLRVTYVSGSVLCRVCLQKRKVSSSTAHTESLHEGYSDAADVAGTSQVRDGVETQGTFI